MLAGYRRSEREVLADRSRTEEHVNDQATCALRLALPYDWRFAECEAGPVADGVC